MSCAKEIERVKPCENIPHLLSFLKTISDENRLKILCFLKEWERCVCEIVKFTWLAQNLVSHHLKKLKEIWLVNARKEWLKVIYSVNCDKIKIYLKEFNSLFEK